MSKKTSWMLIADYAREGVVWKITCIILIVLTVVLAAALAKTAQAPRSIYYIRGDQQTGIAYPNALAEDVVRDMAQRFVLLVSNVSNDTIDEVYKRSLRYLSPQYKTQFIEDQKIVQDAFKSGQINTLFSLEEAKTTVKQLDDQTYYVQFMGTRKVIDKEVRESQPYYYGVTLEKATVTDLNIYGWEITDLKKGPVGQIQAAK